MILTCKECDTSFNMDDHLIQKSGSKVRCSKCQSVFVAYPQSVVDTSDTSSDAEVIPEDAVYDGTSAATLNDIDLDAIEKSLDLELDEGPAEVTDAGLEEPDLDFDLDLTEEESPIASANMEFEETQELDLADFDLLETSETEETSETAEDDLSFDLDSDLETEAPAVEETGGDEGDALDFDLDLDLEDAAAPVTDDVPGTGGVAEEAVDDLDFGLDFEMDADADDMDIEPEVETVDAEADDDLDFSFDLDQEEPDGEAEAELDLEPEPQEKAERAAAMADGVDDLDFDLDLEPDKEAAPTNAESDISDELEFDLDIEPSSESDVTGDLDLTMDDTEELDLADLEDMMDEEQAPVDEAGDDAADDLDFELDFTDDAVNLKDTLSTDMEQEETEELDLTGLDEALDLEEDKAEDSLDLDLGEDAGEEAQVVAEPAGADDLTDFDLSDLDDLMEMEEEAGAVDKLQDSTLAATVGDDAGDEQGLDELEDIDTDGIGADIDIEDEETDLLTPEGEGDQKEEFADSFGMGDLSDVDEAIDTVEDEEVFEGEEEILGAEGETQVATKKGAGKLVKVFIVLVLLAGGGFGAFALAPYLGIDLQDQVKSIPYVGELFGPKVDAAGNLKITILEKKLKGFFIQNPKLDTLYVVQGSVKNDYDHSRGSISITGKLYSKGGKMRQAKTVFAGNMLTQKQLTAFSQAAIDKHLKARAGQKQMNVKVREGKEVPFMIVFTRVPDNLDEFTVQVAGSAEAAK